jgi:hypothetical protein
MITKLMIRHFRGTVKYLDTTKSIPNGQGYRLFLVVIREIAVAQKVFLPTEHFLVGNTPTGLFDSR